jgi:uncharacterized protein (DUF1778 family)
MEAPAMTTGTKSMQINLRIRPAERELIARAAELRHKNLSEFVIDAATRAAEDALASQRVFMADEAQYRTLLREMDRPVAASPELLELLARPAPWEA